MQKIYISVVRVQPGISVSVNYRGKTLFYLGAGTTDKSGGVTPTANTIFRIGSISKVIVVS